MSVIIRLQNLPWSANASDIRNFFRGLSIPEGGVHIVGGEQGDAFIAFSTDEDARQAMLNNGGRIKEVQVKLLLSSRSEMLKVIETARQAVTFMQMASQPALPAQPVITQPTTLPPAITGMLAQNLKQLQQVPGLPLANILPTNISKPAGNQLQIDQKANKDFKSDHRRSRSSSRDRHKKDRSRDKKDKRDRSRSRDRSRDRDRRRRERSRSRDRRDRKRDRSNRSRDRDRSKDRSDRYKDEKKNEIPKETKLPPQMPGSFRGPPGPRLGVTMTQPKNNEGWATNANTMFGQNQQPIVPNVPNQFMNQNPNIRMGWNPSAPPVIPTPNPNMPMQMHNPNFNNGMNMMNPMSIPPNVMTGSPNMDVEQNHSNDFDNMRNTNTFQGDDSAPRNFQDDSAPRNFQDDRDMRPRRGGGEGRGFGRGHPRFKTNNYSNRPDNSFRNSRFSRPLINCCVKLSNLSDRTVYKDIRRFFTGLFIPSNGLKLINDEQGRYTGVAFVKFNTPHDKFEALKRSGRNIKGHNAIIENLDDEEYESGVDLFVPNRKDSDDREDDLDSSQDLIIVENDQPKQVEEKPYKVLFLEDLPAFVKEQDIMKMFSDYSLLSILLWNSKDIRKQFVAYVQFVHADEAKSALSNKAKHLIGHIVVKVSPCYDEDYEQAKLDNTEQDIIEEGNGDIDNEQGDHDMRDNSSPVQDVLTPRDPRQRKFDNKPQEEVHYNSPLLPQPPMIHATMQQQSMYLWRPPNTTPAMPNPTLPLPNRDRMPFSGANSGPNQFNGPPMRSSRFQSEPLLNCIFMKGLPRAATDKDVLNLFSDLNITPTRIHIMLTLQGDPSGDCFCEFTESGEATVAVGKNGGMVSGNRVSIELVPKTVVENALQPNMKSNNFAEDMGDSIPRGGYRGGRPRGRGWGRGRGDFRGRGRGGYGGPPAGMHSNDFTEGFGCPGSVVAMENVPYRASVDEILNFFGDFNISQQDVIRRFNEHGQPTGDARINLHTTFEAQKAVNMLNMRKMRDRLVTLSILQNN